MTVTWGCLLGLCYTKALKNENFYCNYKNFTVMLNFGLSNIVWSTVIFTVYSWCNIVSIQSYNIWTVSRVIWQPGKVSAKPVRHIETQTRSPTSIHKHTHTHTHTCVLTLQNECRSQPNCHQRLLRRYPLVLIGLTKRQIIFNLRMAWKYHFNHTAEPKTPNAQLCL